MYEVIFKEGGDPATLDLSDDPGWALGEERYPIRRTESDLPNWGSDVQYEVGRPDGGLAAGGCSNHDGCGVSTPDGEWGFSRTEEGAMRLGETYRLDIDRDARRVIVTPSPEMPALPYVICGLCLLLEPA